jgi:hypothetical protein
MNKILKLYADTSVYGGVFDEEFSTDSILLFDKINIGSFKLIISTLVLKELELSPIHIKEFVNNLNSENLIYFENNTDIIKLRDEYIKHKILGKSSLNDAEHIASATIAGADIIVSWNFKHIVHYDKIEKFQAVNILNGYYSIKIHTPREVI